MNPASAGRAVAPMDRGIEWLVDAEGCDPTRLQDRAVLESLLRRIATESGLHVVGDGLWHEFPGAGGITGLLLLSESHVACHTFPESSWCSISLYTCRPSGSWDWQAGLRESLGSRRVRVTRIERGPGAGTT